MILIISFHFLRKNALPRPRADVWFRYGCVLYERLGWQ